MPPPVGPLGVLIVEPDRRFADAVTSLMVRRGWRPHRLEGDQPLAGLRRPVLARIRPDIVLVDPVAVSAGDWVSALRARLPDLPLVVCAASSTLEQRVTSLRAGVEHWLTKPVAAEELLATLEAVARHRHVAVAAQALAKGPIEAGDLRLDATSRMCTVDGVIIRFTMRELGVLTYLAMRQGRIAERGEIFSAVWGWSMLERDRTIDVYVRRIRAKLEVVSPDWRYIHTHKGRGYRFEAVRHILDPSREHVEVGT